MELSENILQNLRAIFQYDIDHRFVYFVFFEMRGSYCRRSLILTLAIEKLASGKRPDGGQCTAECPKGTLRIKFSCACCVNATHGIYAQGQMPLILLGHAV